jgi:hypothetical protein
LEQGETIKKLGDFITRKAGRQSATSGFYIQSPIKVQMKDSGKNKTGVRYIVRKF